MLFVGSSVVNPDGSVSLSAPAGFGTVNGVRLANYTASILIINDIDPDYPGQQFLMPLQQCIYPTKNTARYARLEDVSTGAITSTNGVLVEWSTDIDHDFKGLVYPTTITTGGLVAPSADINLLALTDPLIVYEISANPFRTKLTLVNSTGADIQWSSVNGGWSTRPTIEDGEQRSIAATSAVYLRSDSANLLVEVIEESVQPNSLV